MLGVQQYCIKFTNAFVQIKKKCMLCQRHILCLVLIDCNLFVLERADVSMVIKNFFTS